jgi:hypothetical protein
MTAAVVSSEDASMKANTSGGGDMQLGGSHPNGGVMNANGTTAAAGDTTKDDKPEKADGKHSKKKATTDSKRTGGDDDDEVGKDGKKLTSLERCEKRIRAAKRATRSELSVSGGEWTKHGYAWVWLSLHARVSAWSHTLDAINWCLHQWVVCHSPLRVDHIGLDGPAAVN